MTLRLAHAMIQVRDLEGAIAFYQRALGLALAECHSYEGAALAYLRAADGGAELELLSETPWRYADRPETGRSHIAFTVADAAAENARIRSLGIACGDVSNYEANGIRQTRFFYLYDPEGNEIEILEAMGRYAARGT
jgi:lactoylglutathione lyase